MRQRRTTPTTPNSHALLILVVIIAVPVLALVNILLSAKVSHLGFRLAELNQHKESLVNQNQKLEQQIFKQSALTNIHQQAEAQGYTTQAEYLTLPGTLPFAYQNQ